jgi:serine/threonine-protein phosphatase 2B regulatory subunit
MKTAFTKYRYDNHGYITNGDFFTTLQILVEDNLTDIQLQPLVDKTLIAADKDMDRKFHMKSFVIIVKISR